MVVIAPATGVMTLVASKRPPRPTSMTAISVPAPPEELEGDGRRGLEERRQHAQRAVATRRSARSSTSCATALKAPCPPRVADHEPLGDVGRCGEV
jgi:hypothetical protein